LDDLDPDDEALQSKDVQRRRLKKPDGWGLGIECYRITFSCGSNELQVVVKLLIIFTTGDII